MDKIVLTQQQLAAVEQSGGALLVSAAAGSGKTKVLVDRVLRRVCDPAQQKNVDDFLMITFTKAAAQELRGKLIAQLSKRLAQQPDNRHLQKQMSRVYLAQISTVHAFCAVIVRQYAHILELPADFRVCDEQEATMLRERAMREVLDDAYTHFDRQPLLRAAIDNLAPGRDDNTLPELIEKVYNDTQCYVDPQQRLAQMREALDMTKYRDAGQSIWGEYLIAQARVFFKQAAREFAGLYQKAAESGSLEKYLPTLSDNTKTVESLCELDTWEALHLQRPNFGRLAAIQKCQTPEIQEQVKAARKRLVDGVRKQLERFAVSSDEALKDTAVSAQALRGLLALAEQFAQRFREGKLRRHLLDYNDLEQETLRLLLGKSGNPGAVAREISARFAEIMVDEYQDTNAVQDAIFRAISRDGENMFMVGDVKQSIYGFRRADPQIFLRKYASFADYTQAATGEPRKVLLSDNFRSHYEVLAAANDVFRMTMTPRVGGLFYTDAEALRAANPMPAMQSPAVELHCVDMAQSQMPVRREEVEAEFVAARIAKMLREETVPDGENLRPIVPEDIVILMRALTGKAQVYMQALARYGISAVCGSDDIFAEEEVQFLLALLQIIDNPHRDIPLLTVLTAPIFGFTAELLAEIRAASASDEYIDALQASPQEKAREFCALLAQLRDSAQELPLRGLLEEIDGRTMLRAVFGAMPDGAQRVRNIDSFFALADSFDSAEQHGLPAFLRRLAVMQGRSVASDDVAVAGAVRLLTVHKSKGLEFPVVFLADLSKKFNTVDAAKPVLIDSRLGIACNVYDAKQKLLYPTFARRAIADRLNAESMSEEMRVLYVAMTRAKYRLVMSVCAKKMQTKLERIARDLTVPATDALIESASSQGDWLLMTALARTEAGALLQATMPPDCRKVSQYPWHIAMHDGGEFMQRSASVPAEKPPTQKEKPLAPTFGAAYAYKQATQMPTKLTATQLKGRSIDEEISEQAPPQNVQILLQKPHFTAGTRPLTPAQRGTALHLAMQYLRFEACTSTEAISLELSRLEEQRFLTAQQIEAVQPERIFRFFDSALGKRVLAAKQVVREFKFSLLDDAAQYDAALKGEQVLLQGVTDCCIIDEQGLHILDFKTDRVKAGAEQAAALQYRGQLDAYSRALSRIFALPVASKIVYFFATDTAVYL
ncbi:MAG: helicase-exonuclease AddAB subunit AddA [Oscillospiraceae bacterium]|jgi:ATP-dependent helicase/nuclease subunit A|nr:helicase-exonuclease AddAB subunit AddA [Oscillospiraceae bacterium]